MNLLRHVLVATLLTFSVHTTSAHAAPREKTNCSVSNEDDGDQGRGKAINLVAEAYIQGGTKNSDPKFNRLHSVVKEWSSMECKLLDGRPKLNFLLFGFRKVFEAEPNWEKSLQKVRALRTARPNSAYSILAEAQYWVSYAWAARGDGYASSVTPEGWKLFGERLAIAEKILIDNKKIASTLPNWYDLMINVEGTLDRTEEARNSIFFEGAKRYKTFLPLYIPKRNLLEPKWGGSWDAVDDFINWAVDNTKETEGQSMYALLYVGVRDNMQEGKNFFADTRVKWSRLKNGFQDLTRLYPNSKSHIDDFAALACEANDKLTYLDLRKRIDVNSVKSSWVRAAHEQCDSKFGQVK